MNRALGLLIARGWMNLCAIGSFLIVGRFLTPAEFGIYALASSAILLPMALIGAGFTDYVISRDPERKDESTAFWATAATGIGFAILAVLGALLLINVFGLPQMGRILLYLAPLPALWGFSVILESMLIRDDRTGIMTAVTVTAETIGLAALIAAVLMGAGVLSLVVSRLTNNVIMLVGYVTLVRLPRWTGVDKDGVQRLSKFSVGVIGSRIMNWADGYGVEFVIGALLPAAVVGFYRMAGRLNSALGSVLVFAPWQAQLAYLSERFRNAPHRAGAAIRHALELHIGLIAPLFAGLAFSAHDVIALLLGPTWTPTSGVLTIMALGSIAQVIWGVLIASLVASGRSQRMFFFQTCLVVSAGSALALGALWGLQGAVLAKFTVAAAIYVGGMFLIVELGPRERGRVLLLFARMALVIGALAAAMLLTARIAPQGDAVLPSLARIALCSLAGLAAYLAALRAFAPDVARLLLFVARKRWNGRKAKTAPPEAVAPLQM
jgi:O-antigen/teichoic acid export membrane protein